MSSFASKKRAVQETRRRTKQRLQLRGLTGVEANAGLRKRARLYKHERGADSSSSAAAPAPSLLELQQVVLEAVSP